MGSARAVCLLQRALQRPLQRGCGAGTCVQAVVRGVAEVLGEVSRQLRWGRAGTWRSMQIAAEHLRTPSTSLHFIVMLDVHDVQSMRTVAAEKSREKTPEPGAVSAHRPLGTP